MSKNKAVYRLEWRGYDLQLRVAAYCRVSTDSDDQLHSLNSQREYFRRRIDEESEWTLVEIYADEGTSGTSTRKRTEFNRMIVDAESGKVDLILTKEVSRFARNTVDTLNYTRRLKERGIGVLFLNDGIDTRDNDGEFRLAIMASVAQEESRKTSERVRWGQRRSMEQGVVFGNDTTFGFITRQGNLTIREEEAVTVRRIFRKFVLEGKGSHLIARELTEEGIAPPRSPTGEWSNVTILRILRNEKYAGDLRQGKSRTVDYLNHKREQNTANNQIYIKDHHPSIVSRDMFERAQEILSRRSKSTTTAPRQWCSGILRCGLCGVGMVLKETRREGRSPYRAWVCGRRSRSGGWKREEGECSQKYLDDRVLQECLRVALIRLGPEKRELYNSLIADWEQAEQAIGTNGIIERMAGIARKKERLLDIYLAGDISKEEMLLLKSRYEAEQGRLAEQVDRIELEKKSLFTDDRELPFFAESKEVWKTVFKKIIVNPGILQLEFRWIPQEAYIEYETCGRGKRHQVKITGFSLFRHSENMKPE